jgi:hypothetical protein
MPDTSTLPTESGPTVTGLVSGIVNDAQELMRQQVAMARAEVRAEVRRASQAAALLSVGAVVLVPAAILLCNMLVYALHEQAGFSRWASYGIVGGVTVVIGAALVAAGIGRFRSFNPLPDQTVEAFKENVRWMTNPK